MGASEKALKEARDVFRACVVANFCNCDCHKSMSVPGSVVDAVAAALDRTRAEVLEEAAQVAEGFITVSVPHSEWVKRHNDSCKLVARGIRSLLPPHQRGFGAEAEWPKKREGKGMKPITQYMDEISGAIFDKEEDAIKSEKKNGGIKNLFAFWKKRPKFKHCEFENGCWCYQRSESDFVRFQNALIEGVRRFEPWIWKQYKDGMTKEHIKSGYMIGRYLDDNSSELYSWYLLLSNICGTCYREWGQPYYANNCKHNAVAKPLAPKP